MLMAGITFIKMEAQDLGIVVPAQRGTNSRDSHFNWAFESSGGGDVQIGQFACGSYWVAPASGDTGVEVLSLGGNPSWNDFVSCDADPITESHGLLSGSKNYGNYNAAENIIPSLPLSFAPASGSCISLVAAMRRNEAETSNGGTSAIVGEVADAYCVVTILPEPPANGGSDMIRPNMTGASKEFLTWDDFDLTRIPAYAFITGKTAQSWAQTQVRWRSSTEVLGMQTEVSAGTWKLFSEGGRAFRAHNLIPDYASGVAKTFNDDLLALFSSQGTLESKKPALAAMLAYGLDIYHARYDYGTAKRKSWTSGAGQWSGQYLPPVLLAALLRDETKADELRKVAIYSHGNDVAQLGPQELRQVTRGSTGVLLWGDFKPIFRNPNNRVMVEGDWRFWAEFKESACYDTAIENCNPNTGKKTAADPYGYIDGPSNKPGTSYMPVSFGAVRGLAAAMVLMPEIRSVVNTDDPIEYVDRLVRHGLWTAPDPVASIPVVDQNDGCSAWYNPNGTGCVGWGLTWGADQSDVRFAIEDGTGRFPSMNGQAFTATSSYESPAAKDNWTAIMALYEGNTYEDNMVDPGVVVAPEILFETGASPRVHLLCATVDSEIHYTLDGSEPTESSALYAGPVAVIGGTEVRAKAYHADKTASSVRVKTFGTSSVPTTRYWGDGVVLESGDVNTLIPLGWLKLTDGNWAWSYTFTHWVYAPDPGPNPSGAWVYVRR